MGIFDKEIVLESLGATGQVHYSIRNVYAEDKSKLTRPTGPVHEECAPFRSYGKICRWIICNGSRIDGSL